MRPASIWLRPCAARPPRMSNQVPIGMLGETCCPLASCMGGSSDQRRPAVMVRPRFAFHVS